MEELEGELEELRERLARYEAVLDSIGQSWIDEALRTKVFVDPAAPRLPPPPWKITCEGGLDCSEPTKVFVGRSCANPEPTKVFVDPDPLYAEGGCTIA